MREIINMIVVLSLISGTSGLSLAYLKELTAKPIEDQVLFYVQGPAIKSVFADADNDPLAERKSFETPEGPVMVFPAKKGGKLTAVALEGFGGGFGGDIGVIVGIDLAKDSLAGIGVTTLKETPGLGTRVAEPKFQQQFRGLPLDRVGLSGKGGSVDAISGATVSSVGTVTAVNKAIDIYKGLKPQLEGAF
ncbi:RnfABCDGE type electron transport complex subunit G [Desulfocurvus vexinensis]|uniref:RnfABCDGE type electron transport complex subunit G n=1 Tax=Desulfocurvus vexinensis TaxID=399548 RepID=UPI00048B588E|nr:FMN-binding protein [Desulfocurvus vexinensis]